jgi:tRNA threonylcarbamoyladenosine biosynthesis protein TsaB
VIVLALDTTTAAGSCAVLRDGEIRERPGDASRTHGERLPSELMQLLVAERLLLSEIDVFGVATGPGAFTGLRIGIATMQGLAFAEGKPLVGVSSFEALALVASTHDWVARAGGEPPARTATWVDAWRGEVYTSLYHGTDVIDDARVETVERALRRLVPWRAVFTGDGAARYAAQIEERFGAAGIFTDPVSPLLAGAVARLTARAARAGDRPPPDAIRPVYVRRSDAELARDAPVTR